MSKKTQNLQQPQQPQQSDENQSITLTEEDLFFITGGTSSEPVKATLKAYVGLQMPLSDTERDED